MHGSALALWVIGLVTRATALRRSKPANAIFFLDKTRASGRCGNVEVSRAFSRAEKSAAGLLPLLGRPAAFPIPSQGLIDARYFRNAQYAQCEGTNKRDRQDFAGARKRNRNQRRVFDQPIAQRAHGVMTGEHLTAVADILRRQAEAHRVLCTAQSMPRRL
jgi:hypothetical protein